MQKFPVFVHALFYGAVGAAVGVLLAVNTDGVARLLNWPEFGELAPIVLIFGTPTLAVIGLILGGWRGCRA